jgi:hypothetical protein
VPIEGWFLLLLAALLITVLLSKLACSSTWTRMTSNQMDVDPSSQHMLPFPGQLVDGQFETEYIQM